MVEKSRASCAPLSHPPNAPSASQQIFLALPLDEWRVRVCWPQKLYGGELNLRWLAQNCCKGGANQMEYCQTLWEKKHDHAVKRGQHLERFALLNGSVFSAWHNVREARAAPLSALRCGPRPPAPR